MAKNYFRCDYSKYQSEPCENAVCIPLTQGYHAIVDAPSFHLVSCARWHASRNKNVVYAKTSINGKLVGIHRLLSNVPLGMVIDHINHNGLDNRSSNLRVCTNIENTRNSKAMAGKASKYKGVHSGGPNGWQASIICNKKKIRLGRYKTEEEAAMKYNEAAKNLFGEFAYLNSLPIPKFNVEDKADV